MYYLESLLHPLAEGTLLLLTNVLCWGHLWMLAIWDSPPSRRVEVDCIVGNSALLDVPLFVLRFDPLLIQDQRSRDRFHFDGNPCAS
jgi:hypothetical protein